MYLVRSLARAARLGRRMRKASAGRYFYDYN